MSLRSDVLGTLDPIAADVVAQHAPRVDADAAFPTHTIDALRDAGLLGLVTPTEPDFALAAFLTSVLGEGSFLDLLWFLAEDEADALSGLHTRNFM